jgi:nicotinate-nucleotide adenylyltransferase
MSNISPNPASRLGFFGGSFDPPHRGHFAMAESILERASLDLLLLCPAHHAPLRDRPPLFTAHHRLGMVTAMCKKIPNAHAWDYEVNQRKVGYTVDTIREVQKKFSPEKIFLILGSDQFAQLHRWKNIDQLAKLVKFLVFARRPHPIEAPAIPHLLWEEVQNPLWEVSSTSIRKNIERKIPFSNDLTEEVLQYLKDFSLLPNSLF